MEMLGNAALQIRAEVCRAAVADGFRKYLGAMVPQQLAGIEQSKMPESHTPWKKASVLWKQPQYRLKLRRLFLDGAVI